MLADFGLIGNTLIPSSRRPDRKCSLQANNIGSNTNSHSSLTCEGADLQQHLRQTSATCKYEQQTAAHISNAHPHQRFARWRMPRLGSCPQYLYCTLRTVLYLTYCTLRTVLYFTHCTVLSNLLPLLILLFCCIRCCLLPWRLHTAATCC